MILTNLSPWYSTRPSRNTATWYTGQVPVQRVCWIVASGWLSADALVRAGAGAAPDLQPDAIAIAVAIAKSAESVTRAERSMGPSYEVGGTLAAAVGPRGRGR